MSTTKPNFSLYFEDDAYNPVEKDLKVHVTSCFGRSVTLKIKRSQTVRSLKERVAKHFPGTSRHAIRLTYEGSALVDERLLESYGIRDDATITWGQRLLGGLSSCGFGFASLDEGASRGFSNTAPDYRTIRPGLNLEGKCKNSECPVFEKLCWSNLGFNEDSGFDIGRAIMHAKCPLCDERLDSSSIKSCGFYKCSYTFTGGDLTTGKEVSGSDQTWSNSEWIYYDGDDSSRTWSYLTIAVSRKPLPKTIKEGESLNGEISNYSKTDKSRTPPSIHSRHGKIYPAF